jgi:hypothetical protein
MPKNPTDALRWIETHAPRWVREAGAIGLSEQLAQEVADLAAEARARRLAADRAASAARSATLAWKLSVRRAMDRTRAAIAAIKAHAAGAGGPGVYPLAGLPRPQKPGTAGPPASPSSPRFTVRTDGAVELAWTGGGPQGTFYVVKRLLPGEAGWTVVGTTTSKRFTDETLEEGAREVRYAFDAQHGAHRVAGDILVVRLGSRGRRVKRGKDAA